MKNKKYRFNIIDLTVIVAILALVAAFLFRFLDAESDLGTENSIVKYDKKIEYVLHVSSLQNASGELIKEGDVIIDTNTEMALGTVVGVEITPARTETTLPSGKRVISGNPERIDLNITLSTDAHLSSLGSYYIGSYSLLAVNKDFSCRTEKLLFDAKVYSVNRVFESDDESELQNQDMPSETDELNENS